MHQIAERQKRADQYLLVVFTGIGTPVVVGQVGSCFLQSRRLFQIVEVVADFAERLLGSLGVAGGQLDHGCVELDEVSVRAVLLQLLDDVFHRLQRRRRMDDEHVVLADEARDGRGLGQAHRRLAGDDAAQHHRTHHHQRVRIALAGVDELGQAQRTGRTALVLEGHRRRQTGVLQRLPEQQPRPFLVLKQVELEPNFVPSYLQVVDEIPKTASEKPQERLLLKQFAPHAGNVYTERPPRTPLPD